MGYSVTLAATKGATAPTQANIESATELSIQVWLKAAKLRALAAAGHTAMVWVAGPTLATLKVGFFVHGDGAGGLLYPMFWTATSDYTNILDPGGNPIDLTGVADTDDVVLYIGYTPTTGVTDQEGGLYRENGTRIGNACGQNLSAAALPTTAGAGGVWLNYEQETYSAAETAGTFKRVAIWNKAIADANRAVVPVGSEAGLVSLWGDANGFTAGTGTSEPNQVSGASALTLDSGVVWNNIGGGAVTPMLFHRFQSAGRVRRR